MVKAPIRLGANGPIYLRDPAGMSGTRRIEPGTPEHAERIDEARAARATGGQQEPPRLAEIDPPDRTPLTARMQGKRWIARGHPRRWGHLWIR